MRFTQKAITHYATTKVVFPHANSYILSGIIFFEEVSECHPLSISCFKKINHNLI
jgi:hypothetical protein